MIAKNSNAHAKITGAYPQLFSGLSPSDYAEALNAARVKEFTRGEMIWVERDPVRQVLLLSSGLVKVTKLGMNGVEVIVRLGVPGDVLGLVDHLSSGRHCTTMQAFRSCRALAWETAFFQSLVARFPVLHRNLLRVLGRDLLELQDRFREMATERVGCRVARQLIRLLDSIGRSVNGATEVRLSREELAQMTGTTLFSVSRLLSAWEALGIVSSGREAVTVCDIRLLREISIEANFQERVAGG